MHAALVPALAPASRSFRCRVRRCALAAGLSDAEAAERPFIASMGIYVFRKDVLIKLLKSSFPKVRRSLPAVGSALGESPCEVQLW